MTAVIEITSQHHFTALTQRFFYSPFSQHKLQSMRAHKNLNEIFVSHFESKCKEILLLFSLGTINCNFILCIIDITKNEDGKCKANIYNPNKERQKKI